jgi:hypothetical protein
MMFDSLEDQLASDAAVRNLARMIALFYHALVDDGVPEMAAAHLAGTFQEEALRIAWENSTKELEDK